MTNSAKYWLILIAIYLTDCETEPHQIEPDTDYTGQIGTLIDIDNNIYQTIGIGTQIWMAENLATERLNDGAAIPLITNDSIWARYKESAYCIYNNDSINLKRSLGLLYNYYTVNTGLLCPVGWHVPSWAEWDILAKFAGGRDKAGGKLKKMQNSLWEGPNYGFTDNFGFNALPGGRRRYPRGEFLDIGIAGYWWTTNLVDFLQADARVIQNSSTSLHGVTSTKHDGINVRCLKD